MRSAFTLVELSIVLVILGLLVGGIMAGQNLIRAGEFRKMTNDLQQYRSALFIFKEEYLSYPGDMPNATKFWGAADGGNGTGPDCATVPGTGEETCNGDGDGNIKAAIPNRSEVLLAWEHLSNAGLVPGEYNGMGAGALTTRAQHIPGVNSPVTLDGASVLIGSRQDTLGTEEFPMDGWHGWFRIAISGLTGNQAPNIPFLTAEEQWKIDIKLDDGLPGVGSIRGQINSSSWSPGCSTTDDASDAEYAVNTNNKCFIDAYYTD